MNSYFVFFFKCSYKAPANCTHLSRKVFSSGGRKSNPQFHTELSPQRDQPPPVFPNSIIFAFQRISQHVLLFGVACCNPVLPHCSCTTTGVIFFCSVTTKHAWGAGWNEKPLTCTPHPPTPSAIIWDSAYNLTCKH